MIDEALAAKFFWHGVSEQENSEYGPVNLDVTLAKLVADANYEEFKAEIEKRDDLLFRLRGFILNNLKDENTKRAWGLSSMSQDVKEILDNEERR